MITLNNISFSYTHKPIFKNTSIVFNDTITGLVGNNGSGKTTLFEIICNELSLNKGEIILPKNVKIGYLKQQTQFSQYNENCIDFILSTIDYYRNYNELLRKVQNEYSPGILKQFSKAEEIYRINNGYAKREELIKILIGLGIDNPQKVNVDELSYGYKMRLMIAKILVEDNDILLLDEPTNHLDLPSIKWIMDYIKNLEKTIIIVSHDRNFLDNLIKETIEIENAQLKKYKGNYSYYIQTKKREILNIKNEYENLLSEKKRLELLINRFKAKNTKATMAHSKEKIVEKIDKKLKNMELEHKSVIKLKKQLKNALKSDIAIKINIKQKKYANNTILNNININIIPKEKIFLIGRNGIGKSTFLRIISGIDNDFNGSIEYNNKLNVFYFSFDQLENLNNSISVYDYLNNGDLSEFQIKSALGAMLFNEDDYDKRVGVLSGGEKVRLYISKLFIEDFNFIILDEPTNYLDITSIDILGEWLKSIDTGFIIVTHNEYLLKYVDNAEIWEIDNGKIKRTFDNYMNYSLSNKTEYMKEDKKISKTVNNKIKKQEIINKRIEFNKLIKAEETRIIELEKIRENIFKKLSDENAYKKYDIKKLTIKLNNIDRQIKEHYSKWEALIQKKPEF